jgi:sugar/nucleoside kinase (ribokinase family)
MIEKGNMITNYPTIIGSGLAFLDIILSNEFNKPLYEAGGTCGNVLADLSYLKWKSIPVARIGNDIAGRILINDLLKNGVDVKHILVEEQGKTPRIIERLSSNEISAKHVYLVRCPVCQTYLPRFRIPNLKYVRDILEDNKIPQVFFFDLMTPSTLEIAYNYRQAGSLVYFEPNNLQYVVDIKKGFRLSHIVKFSGREDIENTIEADDNIRKILLMGPLLVIKTLGEYGVIYGLRDINKQHYMKSIKLNNVVDSCGAGDWFTIGFLYYLMKIAHN